MRNYWAKVLFCEFIRHFRKLDDAAIVADIHQSMDDIDDLNDDGTHAGGCLRRESASGLQDRGEPPERALPRGRGPGTRRGAAGGRGKGENSPGDRRPRTGNDQAGVPASGRSEGEPVRKDAEARSRGAWQEARNQLRVTAKRKEAKEKYSPL